MKNYKLVRYRLLSITLICSLFIALFLPSSNIAIASSNSIPKVTLAPNVTASLQDAQILVQEQGKIASFTIKVSNQSNSSLRLIDYWAKIKTKSGKSFQTKLKDSDKTKNSIPSKGIAYLTYFADIDSKTVITDLILEIIKWDFSTSNYERSLGKLNASSTGEVLPFKPKELLFGNGKVKAAIKQYNLYKDEKFGYLTVSMVLENLTISSIEMNTLKFFTQTIDGKVFSLESNSTAGLALKPRERKLVSLVTTIPVGELNKKFSVVLAVTEEVNKVNLPIGVFALPQLKVTSPVQQGLKKTLYINGHTVVTNVNESYLTFEGNQQNMTVQFELENTSQSKMNLNGLEINLKTKDGFLYPLTKENENQVDLLPKIKQTFSVKGQIPNQDILKTSEIVLFIKSTENNQSWFVGNFKVNHDKGEQSGNAANYKGFEVKQTSVQRTPKEDNDLIVTEFTLTNKTTQTKPKLSLSGYFVIDGVKIDSEASHMVVLDQLSTVGPNQSYRFVAYTEVPYTQITNKIEYVLNEEDSQKNTKSIYQFSTGELITAKELTKENSYQITNIGKRAEVKYIKSNLFQGFKHDFFYAELEYINLEKRSLSPSMLAGYIQNMNGAIINTNFSEYKERLLPNGKVIISAWVQVPKGFESKEISFYFGESFNLEKDAGKVVIKPVYTNLSAKAQNVQVNLNKTMIQNYLFSMKNIYAALNTSGEFIGDGVNLTFEYDLEKQNLDQVNAEQHKILIEFIDQGTNKATYSKILNLGVLEENAEVFLEGKDIKKTISLSDSKVTLNTNYKGYTLNVYAVFKETKMLLATQDLQWFTNSGGK